ncbi:MAG: hypothetical protein KBA53_13385 [Thermoclostridium sp.]|nr:hypothetical protein [Thermoclostridium sp.]
MAIFHCYVKTRMGNDHITYHLKNGGLQKLVNALINNEDHIPDNIWKDLLASSEAYIPPSLPPKKNKRKNDPNQTKLSF